MKLARIDIIKENHGIEIMPMCPKCNIRLDVEDIKQKQRSRRLLSIIWKVLYVKTMIVKARCPKCHKVYTGFVKTS